MVRKILLILNLLLLLATGSLAGISLTPLLIDLDMKPGSAYEGVLEVTNTGTAPIKVRAMVAGFYSSPNGVPRFIFMEDEKAYAYSGRNLLTLEPSEAVLQGGEVKEFTYKIIFPEVPKPFGGRYMAALFEATPLEEEAAKGGSRIKVATRVACLFLIRPSEPLVLGDQFLDLEVKGSIDKVIVKKVAERRFIIAPVFTNKGNVHIRASEFRGSVIVRSAEGQTVISLPIEPHNILPGTSFILKTVWDVPKDLPAGRYKLEVKIEVTDPYGQKHLFSSQTDVDVG